MTSNVTSTRLQWSSKEPTGNTVLAAPPVVRRTLNVAPPWKSRDATGDTSSSATSKSFTTPPSSYRSTSAWRSVTTRKAPSSRSFPVSRSTRLSTGSPFASRCRRPTSTCVRELPLRSKWHTATDTERDRRQQGRSRTLCGRAETSECLFSFEKCSAIELPETIAEFVIDFLFSTLIEESHSHSQLVVSHPYLSIVMFLVRD